MLLATHCSRIVRGVCRLGFWNYAMDRDVLGVAFSCNADMANTSTWCTALLGTTTSIGMQKHLRKKAASRKKAVLTTNALVVLTATAVLVPKEININSPYPYNYPYGNQKYCHYCPR